MTGLEQRLDALADWLRTHASVWRPRAFYGLPLPWEANHPDVAAFLDSHTTGAAGASEDLEWTSKGPSALRAWAAEGAALAELPRHRATPGLAGGGPHMTIRKAPQIAAFVGAVAPRLPERVTSIVDWCAGKSHLGRSLSGVTGLPLVALERDPALCETGRALATEAGVTATFVQADALDEAAAAVLEPHTLAVALHACGDLHAALIDGARSAFVALAPCCYSRALLPTGLARLLSRRGQAHAEAGLTLDEADLRLIHERPSSTGAGELGQVLRRQAYRLGFDEWHRAARGATGYRHMPAFPPRWADGAFPDFCRRFAVIGSVEPPTEPDTELMRFLALGEARLLRVRRRDQVRSLFRGAVEALMVVDRALALEERGYRVEVGTFCDRGVTPRNALILAVRPSGGGPEP